MSDPVVTDATAGAQPASLDDLQACRHMRRLLHGSQFVSLPFFLPLEGMGGAVCRVEGREYHNFVTYDYLGLNGHPEILESALNSARTHGFGASASRIGGGERPVHRELERALADLYQTEDCAVFVSGHATNVSTLATLFLKGDSIFIDSLAHNSLQVGSHLSAARRIVFPHNDMDALERLLRDKRDSGHAVIVSEGIFSMDGSAAKLPDLVRLKRQYNTFLMLDEAHSLGTLGQTGKGSWEHFRIDPSQVDIWMGTLSKATCTCGGYIACTADVVKTLKYAAPGFVYSVGISPPLAAATLAALNIMRREPERVERLRRNCRLFFELAREKGLDTGRAEGHAVIPVMTRDRLTTVMLADLLRQRHIFAFPALYPAVGKNEGRIRFFLSASHTEDQLRAAVEATADLLPEAIKKGREVATLL